MRKCVARLSRASAGKWSVGAVTAAHRSVDQAGEELAAVAPGLAVCFEVAGETPFSCMVAFRPGDAETVSRGYLGFSYTAVSSAKELLFAEVGNIMVNAFLSSLADALKRRFLPSVPRCVSGEPAFLLEALWAGCGCRKHSVVMITLGLDCDGSSTRSVVAAVIPDELEAALAEAGRA